MMGMSWGRLRLVAFSVVGGALLVVAVVVKVVTIDRASPPLLVGFCLLSALLALIVIFDVAYHARRGQGQACRHCGHLRKMRPFRVYGACPNCGGS